MGRALPVVSSKYRRLMFGIFFISAFPLLRHYTRICQRRLNRQMTHLNSAKDKRNHNHER